MLAVERWGIFETELYGPADGNPFIDVALSAEFSQGGRTVVVDGFYDGEGVYRIRFSPDTPGPWTFVTRSDCAQLSERRGEFVCTPAAESNHGPVQVAHRHHFEHADGVRHQSFGTTCYGWVHQPLERQEQTLYTLASAPFNKLRMCVFPKYYEFHHDPPLMHTFEQRAGGSLDWDRPNVTFFQLLERRIGQLGALGIEADLILFHPYDHYDACKEGLWGYHDMPAAAEDRYLSYLIARVAAYRNVWWSLANEWDFMRAKTPEDWVRFIRVLDEKDPYRRLMGIHNGSRMYDQSAPELTHVSAQRIDTYRTTEDTGKHREAFGKPVVWDEVSYEGDAPHGWGNISAEELVRRFWEGMVRGGYVGHGETYMHPQEILWWSRGGVLHGQSPPRIAFLRAVAQTCPGPGIEPLQGEWDAPAGGCDGQWILHYYGINRPRWRWIRLPDTGDAFKVEVLDTWNMTRTPVPGTHRGNLKVDLPGRPYMAILARRVDPPEGTSPDDYQGSGAGR